MIILLIVTAIILLIILWLVITYNGLVKKRANVEEGWSSIDVFLKKRNDLIPNLVETVKGYASHESNVLQKVVEARNLSSNAHSVKEKNETESTMQNAMMNLFAVAENYPDLKANSNFISLQQDLNSLEDDIEMARRYYNGVVKDNNIAIDSFPSNVVANLFKFKKADFFEIINKTERETVKVSF
ncbi:LemA family protein [Apibacter muscae]|uniref:LemA family protein n=1 Tax=Apibacter muscae TaxID=2509004 RepID=A0A563DH05_9FLAO|nr:LemA family protein [Apibacter muscae]TWP29417.1 LemA family protein [Apibacter muscae]